MTLTDAQVAVVPRLSITFDVGDRLGLAALIRQQIAVDRLGTFAMLDASFELNPNLEGMLSSITSMRSMLSMMEGRASPQELTELQSELEMTASTYRQSREELAAQLELQIISFRIASPWEIVLTAASTSLPVAYSAAAILGLHRLLNMVMIWQRHRVAIAREKEQQEWDRFVRNATINGVLTIAEARSLRQAFEDKVPVRELAPHTATSDTSNESTPGKSEGAEATEQTSGDTDQQSTAVVDQAIARMGVIEDLELLE
jgi:hypothetical protein